MIAFNPNSLCVEAEQHYYDFLYSKGHETTPEHIIDHINRCQDCQERLNQLKAALSQADGAGPEQRQANSAIAAMLRFHFAYIGKPVTCETIKPFLPTLLDPVLQIRVPTPITAHLDNCQQCSEDLETIQGLNFNRKQLRRVSQLFAEKPTEDAVSCSEARAAILAVISMDFRDTSAEVLKHLCTCPDCRKALYEYRESVRTDLFGIGKVQNEFPCESVSTTDIFDYVVLYGLDPSADQYAKFREPLTSHLWACPACLAKIQELHNTVYGIAERADSEINTIYHIDESAVAQEAGESDDLYSGFPVRVEIADSKGQVMPEEKVSTISFAAALKQRVSAVNVKPLAKIAVIAAAILIGVALLLNTPTAKAVTIAEVYKALENVKNVYIVRFVSGRKEPIQEQWVSRRFKVWLIKTEGELILWDIPNGTMKVKQLDSGAIEIRSLPPEMISDAEKRIAGSLGLVPFTELSSLPEGSKWSPASNDRLPTVAEGIEVYDLTWPEKIHDGPVIFKMCRFFVDRETKLPQRVEYYQKSTTDVEYSLRIVAVAEYLSERDIQKVIEEASF